MVWSTKQILLYNSILYMRINIPLLFVIYCYGMPLHAGEAAHAAEFPCIITKDTHVHPLASDYIADTGTEYNSILQHLKAEFNRIAGMPIGYGRSYANRSASVRQAALFMQRNGSDNDVHRTLLHAIARLIINPERDITHYKAFDNPRDFMIEFIKHPNNNHIVSYRMALIFLAAFKDFAMLLAIINYQPQWMSSFDSLLQHLQEEEKAQDSVFDWATTPCFISQRRHMELQVNKKIADGKRFLQHITSLIDKDDPTSTSLAIRKCLAHNDKQEAQDVAPLNVILGNTSILTTLMRYTYLDLTLEFLGRGGNVNITQEGIHPTPLHQLNKGELFRYLSSSRYKHLAFHLEMYGGTMYIRRLRNPDRVERSRASPA